MTTQLVQGLPPFHYDNAVGAPIGPQWKTIFEVMIG